MRQGEPGAGDEEDKQWQEVSQVPPPKWVSGALELEVLQFCHVIAVLREDEVEDIEEGYIKLKTPTRPQVQRVVNAIPVRAFEAPSC